MEPELRLSLGTGEPQKQMTIFYKGRVSVCSATEMQAKAILSMAKREMEEEEKKVMMKQEIAPQVMLNAGLSMKRSLQRFLQKRKARIHDASASPYAAHANLKRMHFHNISDQ
ncbi:protein TIFY 5A-like [Curcuma longa]|uniref:protein TIFY 5A-like n=1 Tax=Curcuma longa TaxID=136217 RepID=UPI003D9E0E94